MSYAEMLKKIKANVAPDECGVQIQSVHKTAKGEVRINLLERSAGGREQLARCIQGGTQPGCEEKSNVEKREIVILDIAEDTEKDEVEKTSSEYLDIPTGEINTNDFRGLYRGSKMITAFVPTMAAKKLWKTERSKLDGQCAGLRSAQLQTSVINVNNMGIWQGTAEVKCRKEDV